MPQRDLPNVASMYTGPYEIVPGHYAEVNEAGCGEGRKGVRGREEERKRGGEEKRREEKRREEEREEKGSLESILKCVSSYV